MPSGVIPRHILMSTDAVGGVWTYAIDLSRGLSALGVEVTLAVLGPAPGPQQAATAQAIRCVRLLETGLPLDWTTMWPGRSGRRPPPAHRTSPRRRGRGC